MGCMLCPRQCNADRDGGEVGYCAMPAEVRVARAALHPFEEPPISGTRGSGTVFFVGCSLRCVFCQNSAIRSPDCGKAFSVTELGELFLALQREGAHNINLVTPTHYADKIAAALAAVRERLTIPVVYNCGGYERVETLQMLDGLVDIYLPDFKYSDASLSGDYSAAPDYSAYATAALAEMLRQVGEVRLDENGLMTRGVMVRHLVLPGSRKDSMAVLELIAKTVPVSGIRLSLMRQYTPDFAPRSAPKSLKRRLTSFEYNSVMEHAISLGFEGYFQTGESVGTEYTPDFSASVFPENKDT
ncbi:MAG: radical SAM protein [Clostridia bacterium]|nr:radical SAM protein [Clostridia bacterium]MBQ8716385.1 radical SAM protein [Clostridia bacterium]